jgi:ABC-type lipoprotein export system ATPase subunit
MTIEFDNVIPDPIRSNYNPNSEIWNHRFTFQQGKEYVINAKSGKGKSTFIEIIYGVRKDYSGKVFLHLDQMNTLSNAKLADFRQDNLAVMFQDLRLFTELSAKENILVNAVLNDKSPIHYIAEWANHLGVAHLLEKRAGLLSYGERQRIALIRALIQPFDWLLLDEPFSHLDLDNTKTAYSLIKKRAKEQNAGVIITTLGEDHFLKGETIQL